MRRIAMATGMSQHSLDVLVLYRLVAFSRVWDLCLRRVVF